MIYLFWVSVGFIVYTYLGYPLFLGFLSFFRNRRDGEIKGDDPKFLPKVSLIVSAYNEGSVIEKKIHNSLALNYPRELLEIVVVSDGSNDETNGIVSRYSHQGIILRHYEGRIGKTACLNKTIPLTKGDILIFSDANSMYEPNAVKELARHFSSGETGFVTGWTRYVSEKGEKIADAIGIHSRIEILIKKLESRVSSCVSADGAIFSIRKKLYEPLKDFDINDFVIPLNIIRKGYRGTFEQKACCIEGFRGSFDEEFDRQVRITNRTLRALFNHVDMMNPFKFGLFSFSLISHKLFKFLVPVSAVTLLVANITLITHGSIYTFMFAGQLAFYLLAGLKHSNLRDGKLISLSYAFIIVNVAILLGWIKYFRGEQYITWSQTRR
ncbi:glycosyltransferase family 2 protein [Candidatus Bathyarchaeota archaeon]|nr:glycosyltransferase family 2 protein [Candidatus Bathyarchaeota archaeon]